MQAVADDRDTAVAEVWQLRDAYTPAEDALGELLPSAHRLNDVHAGMLTDGGARLQLATGPVVVPPHMRKVLTAVFRQLVGWGSRRGRTSRRHRLR
jgi:hypothetical protein